MAEFQSKFDTLRWRGGRLEMIDQRVLPDEIRYLAYDSAAAVAAGIRDMVVRGAPAIGCAAAYGIALEALRLQRHSAEEFNAGLDSAFSVLAGSRPTAVNLFWALARMLARRPPINCWMSGTTPPLYGTRPSTPSGTSFSVASSAS